MEGKHPWKLVTALSTVRMPAQTSSPLRPNRSAIAVSRWGRKVPSVSMYIAFPSPPPASRGSWQATQSVWQSWVLPVRNSPNTSVRDPVSIPPSRSLSSSLLPVVRAMRSWRWSKCWDAVVKPMGTSLYTVSFSLAAFWSLIPFTSTSFRMVEWAICEQSWELPSVSSVNNFQLCYIHALVIFTLVLECTKCIPQPSTVGYAVTT